MRWSGWMGACVLAGSALAAEFAVEGVLEVERMTVRFGPPPPDGRRTFAIRAPSRLRLAATFEPALLPPGFDPGTDHLSLSVAGIPILEGPAFAAETSVHVRGTGEFVLRQVRPYEGRGALLLRIDPVQGRLLLDARGADLGRLLGDGPGETEIVFNAGGIVHRATVDLRPVRPGAWEAP